MRMHAWKKQCAQVPPATNSHALEVGFVLCNLPLIVLEREVCLGTPTLPSVDGVGFRWRPRICSGCAWLMPEHNVPETWAFLNIPCHAQDA